MSTLFLRTLREDPADAEVPSHRLLVRAGYVRRVAPGIYSWLPLGLKVLNNVATVVREEMDAIGAQEVQFPALLPREPYETTGRWTEYGEGLFRLKDRKGGDYLLGPTHEEMFTLMVKGECSSYKDLPLSLYQIQTKYRDEARPRAGILRGREFLMKDSYSFDLTDEGLAASYQAHRDAYVRIFERLGLEYKIVSAVSGAMGGSASEEFLGVAPTGEDTYVSCASCDYAANVEAATVRVPDDADPDAAAPLEVLDTPDTPTIDTLVTVMNDLGHPITAADTLKNVVLQLKQPTGERSLLVIGVPGDREVDLKAVEANVFPAELEPFDDFAKHPGLVKGYLGPQVLKDLKITYLVDPRVTQGSAWVTGANEPGRHAVNVVMGRDFEPDGVVPAAEVREGEGCPVCGSPLSIDRGIEIGHVFQLGRKFADAFGLDVLGPEGKPVRVTMGSYGIGVSRAVAAIAEQSHDDKGLVWPRSVAPADVHVVGVGKGDHKPVAERLAAELEAQGLRVLLDDRKASPGVAFKDAELIGIPTTLVIGKSLEDGEVELRDRRSGESRKLALDDAVAAVVAEVRG
ncbi:MAG: prolyl-tRNA synthetase [Frankiales bacterium]|jgi:prolyl-tRNA synthetase|nr:prolyl-tRNA synthetase [Frankiales bacterium]